MAWIKFSDKLPNDKQKIQIQVPGNFRLTGVYHTEDGGFVTCSTMIRRRYMKNLLTLKFEWRPREEMTESWDVPRQKNSFCLSCGSAVTGNNQCHKCGNVLGEPDLQTQITRLLGLVTHPSPAKKGAVRISWMVKMPDGQLLGGIESQEAANHKAEKLITEGGVSIYWVIEFPKKEGK